jgi:hypothetical protein
MARVWAVAPLKRNAACRTAESFRTTQLAEIKQTLRDLSPRANFADRATAACRTS